MNTLRKSALILTLVCGLAALTLGIVNQMTVEIIALRMLEEQQEARQLVFYEAEEFEILTLPEAQLERIREEYQVTILETLTAIGNGQKLGYVFRVSTAGYGGQIILMVGISSRDRRIVGVHVLEHQETPGLGSEIATPDFLDQLIEKPIDDPFSLGQDIEAITGATISSRAVLGACLGAVRLFEGVEE